MCVSFSLCVSLHIFFVSLVCFFLLLLYVLHFSWLNNCSFHLQLPFVCTLSLSLLVAVIVAVPPSTSPSVVVVAVVNNVMRPLK